MGKVIYKPTGAAKEYEDYEKVYENYVSLLRKLLSAVQTDGHPQSPWVSIKDRLPEVDIGDSAATGGRSMLVLTASRAGGYSINRWDGREWLYTGAVDYWQPIPALPDDT